MEGRALTLTLKLTQPLRSRATFHTLPFVIYARKFYACTCTQVKITRQWESTFRVDFHCRVIFTCVRA